MKSGTILLNLGEALSCGGCGEITTVRSPFTCKTCGRMLCGDCGKFCTDHKKKTKHTKRASLK